MPTSPGSSRASASSSVVSSPANRTAVAPVIWRRKVTALALGGVDDGGFQDPLAVLEEHALAVLQQGARGGHGVLGDVIGSQPGVQHHACRLVLEHGARCLRDDLGEDAADLGQQRPLRLRPASRPADPGPSQASAPWLPISSESTGGEATPRRLARARPEMSAVVVRGRTRARQRRRPTRGSGRASSAWPHDRRHGAVEVHGHQQVFRARRCSGRLPGVQGTGRAALAVPGLRSHRGPPSRSAPAGSRLTSGRRRAPGSACAWTASGGRLPAAASPRRS